MRNTIVAVCLLESLARAAAPVRDDIVELRHRRTPNPYVFLGWTRDGRAVVHSAACGVNDGGGPFCHSELDVIDGKGTQATKVLEPTCGKCDPNADDFRWEVSPKLAAQAIRAERDALAAL